MLKIFAMAGLAALVTACATPPPPGGAADTLQGRRPTAEGTSKAADLGFHGPVYRNASPDGPN